MAASISKQRFDEFLAEIKTAKTDEEILMAGHNLLEKWRAYKYQHISDAALKTITNKNK